MKPWIGKRNYFELYEGYDEFEAANAEFCALAERIWIAGKDDDIFELRKLAKEFRQLQFKWRVVGSCDSEPHIHMATVAAKSVSGSCDDDFENTVYCLFR